MPRRVPGFFSDRFRIFPILDDHGVADLAKHSSPRNLSLKNEFASRERYLVSPPTRRFFPARPGLCRGMEEFLSRHAVSELDSCTEPVVPR